MVAQASAKLNLLIRKYPDSPAAAKARDLLSQLNSQ
jgi:outer membrane protein assembly factor BamD (BamD/ComL family)